MPAGMICQSSTAPVPGPLVTHAICALASFSPLVAPRLVSGARRSRPPGNSQSIKNRASLSKDRNGNNAHKRLCNRSLWPPGHWSRARNFRVFEDGVEQEIVRFSGEDVPISIGVIFDMSGSMADKIEKSRLAAVQFFRTANPQDEFFLVNFNDRAQLASPFTASVEELQNRLMFTTAHGQTALLDGIYLGLSQMKGAHNTKKALLIISDGGDNHSRYTEMDIRKYLHEADVQIYAIGIYDAGRRAHAGRAKRARRYWLN